MNLVISFAGWCLMRLPTDPDPSDERRGVSGYTFAFAGEPDLDRVLYLQPPPQTPGGFTLRLGTPELGVKVTKAVRTDATPVSELEGATVNLLDRPVLENRNWVLTLPGYEPIVPFKLEIARDGLQIRREAPLNQAAPDQPVWQATAAELAVQGAHGMEYEPDTIGRATGIWDSLQLVKDRLAALQQEWASESDPVRKTALDGRIKELTIAINNRNDRRVMARYFVERFAFAMIGTTTVTVDQQFGLGGQIDTMNPWPISFWMGAWDPDLLCLYLQGSLQIPYLQISKA